MFVVGIESSVGPKQHGIRWGSVCLDETAWAVWVRLNEVRVRRWMDGWWVGDTTYLGQDELAMVLPARVDRVIRGEEAEVPLEYVVLKGEEPKEGLRVLKGGESVRGSMHVWVNKLVSVNMNNNVT